MLIKKCIMLLLVSMFILTSCAIVGKGYDEGFTVDEYKLPFKDYKAKKELLLKDLTYEKMGEYIKKNIFKDFEFEFYQIYDEDLLPENRSVKFYLAPYDNFGDRIITTSYIELVFDKTKLISYKEVGSLLFDIMEIGNSQKLFEANPEKNAMDNASASLEKKLNNKNYEIIYQEVIKRYNIPNKQFFYQVKTSYLNENAEAYEDIYEEFLNTNN